MKVGTSEQFNKPVVIVEPGDKHEDVVAKCHEVGATFSEELHGDCAVIDLRGFPELYTWDALKRSLVPEVPTTKRKGNK